MACKFLTIHPGNLPQKDMETIRQPEADIPDSDQSSAIFTPVAQSPLPCRHVPPGAPHQYYTYDKYIKFGMVYAYNSPVVVKSNIRQQPIWRC